MPKYLVRNKYEVEVELEVEAKSIAEAVDKGPSWDGVSQPVGNVELRSVLTQVFDLKNGTFDESEPVWEAGS